MTEAKQFRLKRTLFGRFVLEVKEVRHYCRDLAGSGFYDEYSREVWRKATLEEAIESGLSVA